MKSLLFLIRRLAAGPQPPAMVPTLDEDLAPEDAVWPDERLVYLARHRGGRHGLDLTVAAVRGRHGVDAQVSQAAALQHAEELAARREALR
jgi:hypothetical protein